MPSPFQTTLIEKTAGNYSSYTQSLFDFDRTNYLNLESIYQNSQNSPKYKIRLISKKSGKIIDINVKYKYQVKNNVKQK